MPDKISSIITPIPPGKRSMRRMPNGLKISNKRNSAKAPKAYPICPEGTASRAIQVPTISSTTTREGSSPQHFSKRLAAHTPAQVNAKMKATVSHNKQTSETKKDSPNQIRAATKAPAVPGAKGENPEPKPVPIMTERSEGFFIKKVIRQ